MCSGPVLKSPDFEKGFVVQVDVSALGNEAVMAQGSEGKERPIAYLSRTLLPRETRYSGEGGLSNQMGTGGIGLCYYLLGREFILANLNATQWPGYVVPELQYRAGVQHVQHVCLKGESTKYVINVLIFLG